MPGLVPGIHAAPTQPGQSSLRKDVDGRDKPGHDDLWNIARSHGTAIALFCSPSKRSNCIERKMS